MAVALGIVEAHHAQAPRIWYRHGKTTRRPESLEVEHYPTLPAKTRKVALASLERAVHHTHYLIWLARLGVERIVGIRALKHHHLVGIIVVEIHESPHLLLGYGEQGRLSP